MEIIVLNGSPKGQASVTMQYVEFLSKSLPDHTFTRLDVAQQIRRLETDPAALADTLGRIRQADAVLWAFPLYFLLVPSQYKRFIEIVSTPPAADAFRGKYAAALTTSIHFFDQTAHSYIRAVAEDLGMHYYGGYSAEMKDLFSSDERARLRTFADSWLGAVRSRAPLAKAHPPLTPVSHTYIPGPSETTIDAAGRKILILHDARLSDINLTGMVERFAAAFTGQVTTVNLHDLDIKGGCVGCMSCAYDNTCIYNGKDGYSDFFNNVFRAADIIVFAGAIHDRYLSARWKTFFDRTFFNNHVPVISGKQVAVLISGPLGQIHNLRQILEAYCELQEANLVGIATDEAGDALDGIIDRLAAAAMDAARRGYTPPPTFYGIGGRKIFRDAIWGHMRFPFVADHKYFLSHGRYDFPQRERLTRWQNILLYWAAKIPAIRRQLYGPKMNEHMLAPFKKLLGSL
jgi:multimeric flavodoxin WrbA